MSTTVLDTQTRKIRTMRLMDETGHASFGWDEENDEQVLRMIERLMDQGYVFWIIKRDPLREVELRHIAEIGNTRHVVIRNEVVQQLLSQGALGLVEDIGDDEPLERVGRARTPREAMENDTVAHRGLRGG